MTRLKYILLSALTVLSYTLNAQELRSGIKVKREIAPKLETVMKLQLRKDLNNPNHVISKSTLQAGLKYEPVKNLDIAGTCRYMISKKNNEELTGIDSYKDKYRFTLDISYSSNRFKNHVQYSNRLRYQYSIINPEKSTEILRNKIGCNYKISNKVVPYFAVEPYYELEDGMLKTVRFYFGSNFKLAKNGIDVFTILEVNREEKVMTTSQVFGLMYRF